MFEGGYYTITPYTVYILCPPHFNIDLHSMYGYYFVERLIIDNIAYRFILFEPTSDHWLGKISIINNFKFYKEVIDRSSLINIIALLVNQESISQNPLDKKRLNTSISILNTMIFAL